MLHGSRRSAGEALDYRHQQLSCTVITVTPMFQLRQVTVVRVYFFTSVLREYVSTRKVHPTQDMSRWKSQMFWALAKFHSQSRTTCFLSCFTSLLVDPVVEKQLIAATKEGTEDWGGWHPAVKASFVVDLEYVMPCSPNSFLAQSI